MSKRKGRKYELELKALLERYGCTVIDVASNAGLTGTFDADLLVWAPGHGPLPGWQNRQDGYMVELEVKYRKSGTGFSAIYDTHLATVGLGSPACVQWADVRTGGPLAWLAWFGYPSEEYPWEEQRAALTAFTKKAFKPGVTVVACRASRKPWVFIWDRGV